MNIALVTGSILIGLGPPAAAQPASSAPTPMPATAPLPDPPPAPGPAGAPLSEGVALTLAIGGTLGSCAVMVGPLYFTNSDDAVWLAAAGALGTFLAPSFGHWYAGKYLTRGVGLRAAGVLSLAAAVAVAVAEHSLIADEYSAERSWKTEALALAGAALLLGGAVDDMVTTPRRVRQRNRARSVAIAPLASPGLAGLALGGRF